VTVSETLTAYDILKMYLVALENVNKIWSFLYYQLFIIFQIIIFS
jgi:hypothetical protein